MLSSLLQLTFMETEPLITAVWPNCLGWARLVDAWRKRACCNLREFNDTISQACNISWKANRGIHSSFSLAIFTLFSILFLFYLLENGTKTFLRFRWSFSLVLLTHPGRLWITRLWCQCACVTPHAFAHSLNYFPSFAFSIYALY